MNNANLHELARLLDAILEESEGEYDRLDPKMEYILDEVEVLNNALKEVGV